VARPILHAKGSFEDGFARIRAELDVPKNFSEAVLTEAEKATPAPTERLDARHIPFLAIDPPGATDLDQAFAAERLGDGYRVFYAIADVAAFVTPGGAIDTEARKRGVTLYSPDIRTPLHPPRISEDRASLLTDGDRPALLWTIDLDSAGTPIDSNFQRAEVRTRENIDYKTAQRRIDGGEDGSLGLLGEIGQLRQDQEAARGGVSLNLPSQEVVETDGTYMLAYDASIPVEGWNAQISLLTGMVAGHTMHDAGVGVLRTLPPPRKQDLRRLRRQAKALGIDWPDNLAYADMVRNVHPDTPQSSAFLLQAARSFRGAGYVGFKDGELPDHPEHGAIASIYGHVTAPLRRLVDRFANEILLALYAGHEPSAWAVEALDELPSQMGKSRSKESALDRAMLDFVEALCLSSRVGQTFEGFVIDVNKDRGRATVQIAEPAVVANIKPDGRTPAETLSLRLEEANPHERKIRFSVEN
jgi:exoribonuclease R